MMNKSIILVSQAALPDSTKAILKRNGLVDARAALAWLTRQKREEVDSLFSLEEIEQTESCLKALLPVNYQYSKVSIPAMGAMSFPKATPKNDESVEAELQGKHSYEIKEDGYEDNNNESD